MGVNNMKNLAVECNKYETLYDYLKTIKTEDFGFDVYCLNKDNCCWGNKEDIDGLLCDNLKKCKGKDVVKIEYFYSEIAQVQWYRFTINYMNINDKRNGITYDKRLNESSDIQKECKK